MNNQEILYRTYVADALQFSDAFVGLGGDVDEDEPTTTEVANELDGVAPVGLAMLAGRRGKNYVEARWHSTPPR